MKNLILYFSGQWMPESEAKVSIFDDGFMRGDAVYDIARTFQGVPFQLEDHIDRFLESCRYLQFNLSHSKAELIKLGEEVVQRNFSHLPTYGDFWIDYHVSRGIEREGYPSSPQLMIFCDPIPFKKRAPFYRDGISIAVSPIRRTPPWALSPRAKTHNQLNFVVAELQQISKSQSNAHAWPILLDENGNLSEGPMCNIFLVKNQTLYTPQEQYALSGVSRRNILKLAHDLNIATHEKNLDLYDLYTADEIFLTSTSLCLCPVSQADGRNLTPWGPITSQLHGAYSQWVGLDIREQYLSYL